MEETLTVKLEDLQKLWKKLDYILKLSCDIECRLGALLCRKKYQVDPVMRIHTKARVNKELTKKVLNDINKLRNGRLTNAKV